MRREISVATLAKAGAFNRPMKFPFHQMIWRMENDAILSPVQRAVVWRVQIVWPNGTVQHVGPFASEKEAAKWIAGHAWWAKNKIPNNNPGSGSHVGRSPTA